MRVDRIPFLVRSVPLGPRQQFATYEYAAVPGEPGTWLVLRENSTASQEAPLLMGHFEYVASMLQLELVSLRRAPQPLRFFHCRYELRSPGPTWNLKEVILGLKDGLYVAARWAEIDEVSRSRLNASLSLMESPERKLL